MKFVYGMVNYANITIHATISRSLFSSVVLFAGTASGEELRVMRPAVWRRHILRW